MVDMINRADRHTTEQLATITPVQGDVLMDTTKGTLVVGDGMTKGGKPMARENIAAVFAYLTAPETTTVETAGTYYPVEGVFNNSPMKGFDIILGKLTYINPVPAYFEVDWHAAFSYAASGAILSFGIDINDVVVPSSVMASVANVATRTASGTTVVLLSEGDTVRLVVTSDSDADDVNVKSYTTTIRNFCDG